jgi:2-polyprenyl-6-methoxyphenol hydroxylase-like FAD-dependent oxidoreductase
LIGADGIKSAVRHQFVGECRQDRSPGFEFYRSWGGCSALSHWHHRGFWATGETTRNRRFAGEH